MADSGWFSAATFGLFGMSDYLSLWSSRGNIFDDPRHTILDILELMVDCRYSCNHTPTEAKEDATSKLSGKRLHHMADLHSAPRYTPGYRQGTPLLGLFSAQAIYLA